MATSTFLKGQPTRRHTPGKPPGRARPRRRHHQLIEMICPGKTDDPMTAVLTLAFSKATASPPSHFAFTLVVTRSTTRPPSSSARSSGAARLPSVLFLATRAPLGVRQPRALPRPCPREVAGGRGHSHGEKETWWTAQLEPLSARQIRPRVPRALTPVQSRPRGSNHLCPSPSSPAPPSTSPTPAATRRPRALARGPGVDVQHQRAARTSFSTGATPRSPYFEGAPNYVMSPPAPRQIPPSRHDVVPPCLSQSAPSPRHELRFSATKK